MPFLPFIINTNKAILPPHFLHYQSNPHGLLQNENSRLPTPDSRLPTPGSRLLTPDFPRALSHHPDRFFLRTEHIVYVHQVMGQFVVSFSHKPDEDVEVMDAVEDQDFFTGQFVFCL